MTKPISIVVLLGAAVLASCGTNAVQNITGPLPSARVRFFNFGVNAPPVNFYAGSAKMTAVSSTSGVESTNGVSYGGVGSSGFYSAITPGQYDLTGRIAATTDKDLTIAKVAAAIADGKLYSFYMSGFYDANAKTVDGFLVEDPVPAAFDYTQAYVRFVNAIGNANPLILYAKSTTTGTEVPLGVAVAYKNAGTFTALPGAVYDLSARYAGAVTNAITRTGVSFLAGHMYTVSSRGDITVTSTTAATRPFLDNTANR